MLHNLKKTVAVLSTVAVMASVGAPAFAATYSANSVQQIEASGTISGLRVVVTVPADTLTAQDKVRFTLPTDLRFVDGTTDANITLGTPAVGSSLDNQFTNATVTAGNYAGAASGNDFFEVTVDPTVAGANAIGEGRLVIDLPDMKADGLSAGDIKLKAEAASNSAFTNASITIATVGSGTVAVSIDDIKTITSAGGQAVDTIYFKEDRNGALKEDASNSIKLKLPAGYKWANAGTLQNNWGTDVTALATVEKGSDDRELIIKTTGTTTSASYFQLNGATVDVDESIAKKGDVVVNLSGATTTTPNSFTIARYGEFNTGIAVYGDVPTIAAGKNGDTVSEIGAFKIEEEVKGSLIGGRTITFTLPEGARWGTAGTPLQAPTRSGDTKDGGIGEFTWTIVDNQDANRILKATIPAGADSSTAAKLIYEKAQIATAVDFSGDLTVEVGGTAGITGNLVLGKIVPAVTVAASEVKPVTLGLGAQPLGDITITEGIQEALNKDAAATTSSEADGGVNDYVVNVQLPLGVYFSGTPKVEVASGDMMIEASSVTVNQNGSDGSQGSLRFNVRSSSTTPSAIKISDVKVTADRTVPEGDIIVKVRGTAVNKSGFAGRGTAASAVIGKLVTPASGEVKADASFKIGDTKYTVNGMEKSMDVAPYIKNSRTYMPVRYVAEALGVSSDNIIWDADSQSVTLIKGSTIAQMTIGSPQMKVNGTTIYMDAAPEITSDRTMLPLRFIAQALGASVHWDDATQTATLK